MLRLVTMFARHGSKISENSPQLSFSMYHTESGSMAAVQWPFAIAQGDVRMATLGIFWHGVAGGVIEKSQM